MIPFVLPALQAVAGGSGGFVSTLFTGAANLGNWLGGLIAGNGPDIEQRVKDYNTYYHQGKVLGGDPKDDSTWIFNFDYMRKNPNDPWKGVLNDSRFVKNWNNYLATIGYYDNGKQAVPLKDAPKDGDKPPSSEKQSGGYTWIAWVAGIGVVLYGVYYLFFKSKRK